MAPRVTQAEQIAQNNEQTALAHFEQLLGALHDPRRPQGIRYPLRSVVVIALMAMVCGCDNAESMDVWGELQQDWLREVIDLPHGAPSQDVYLSVFASLDPTAFSAVFAAWSTWLRIRLGASTPHIAIDGKTSRRTHDNANEIPALHTVSAWASEAGLVIAQCKTDTKSNEITAIPELLRILDLRRATVTIDAMGCQREIAQTIIAGEGDYLLAVKDNQPTLHAELIETFAEAQDTRRRTVDEAPQPVTENYTETEKGHGRIETRTVRVCRDLTWVQTHQRWASLACIVEVTRERTILASNKTSLEKAYYIGSDSTLTAPRAADLIRRHWSIENNLHWILDMAFREDEARHRAKNTAQNFATLRHFALAILKQDSARKVGIAIARQRAGWDRAYLIQLLTQPAA
jgi:predicted transposase YbfD/YdcC